jgi:Alkylmercury lyase
MLAFRSEAHVERWLEQRGLDRGALFSAEQMWRLARAWYENRLAPDWRRRTAEEAEGLFGAIGLVGDFWRLTPSGG